MVESKIMLLASRCLRRNRDHSEVCTVSSQHAEEQTSQNLPKIFRAFLLSPVSTSPPWDCTCCRNTLCKQRGGGDSRYTTAQPSLLL